MPGVIPFLRQGPGSYQVLNASSPITGGQLVMPDPANLGGIIPAQAGAENVLGVAGLDGALRTNQDGQNPAVLSQQSPWIPVYYGVDIPVTYNGACNLGVLLVAGPNGTVSPYTPANVVGGTYPGGNPTVPATGVAVTNGAIEDVQVVITGGTMTNVQINGVSEGVGAGTYTVPGGGTIVLTYTVAPTWAWTLAGATVAATPAVPATTVPVLNNTGYNASVVITAGTMTQVIIGGVQMGTGAGTYTVPANETISLTYSVAPTWAWTVLVSTFDQIVGRCTETLGVNGAGTVARARIGFLV
jgi:hypothetical protein